MIITYANSKVEKYFTDFNKLKKKLPVEWVRALKKHLDHLEAADCFGDFLSLGLGRPEQLCEGMAFVARQQAGQAERKQ